MIALWLVVYLAGGVATGAAAGGWAGGGARWMVARPGAVVSGDHPDDEGGQAMSVHVRKPKGSSEDTANGGQPTVLVVQLGQHVTMLSQADVMQLKMQLSAATKPANAGRSLLERMWDNLDAAYSNLKNTRGATATEYAREHCRGLAEQIAVMQVCDLDTVRQQAHERWVDRPKPRKTKARKRS